ncbi:MAG: hypothetical protein JXP48_05715 [Acidobacteria bacterium]|nr:hypothetical protein [Acidobacteriota bacterium]
MLHHPFSMTTSIVLGSPGFGDAQFFLVSGYDELSVMKAFGTDLSVMPKNQVIHPEYGGILGEDLRWWIGRLPE